ncbi:hypothetical protein J3Q64DRAFT_1751426 [Phycomyces blakesleeanus]|uniref:Uncharacterized protein n=1 Tax=Phycomyces blakesleeanus TaxID=4837 RepID=A0ABR3AWV8_PHYBL
MLFYFHPRVTMADFIITIKLIFNIPKALCAFVPFFLQKRLLLLFLLLFNTNLNLCTIILLRYSNFEEIGSFFFIIFFCTKNRLPVFEEQFQFISLDRHTL